MTRFCVFERQPQRPPQRRGRPPARPEAGAKALSGRAILRYNLDIFRYRSAVGELIEQGAASGGFSLLSGLVCLVALGLYGLMGRDQENNDDDDSSPGGGLMQPVA